MHALTSCVCVLTSLPGDGETEYRKEAVVTESNVHLFICFVVLLGYCAEDGFVWWRV